MAWGWVGIAIGTTCLSTWSIAERCMFACARERTQLAELVVATLADVPRRHGCACIMMKVSQTLKTTWNS